MLESELGSWMAVLMCGVAALTDARTGMIPNKLTFPAIVGAPLLHGWFSGVGALLMSLLAIALCGLVPYLMFRRGGMGGGDVKLFAAVGGAAGVGFGLQVQVASMVFACLWGLGWLAYRGQLWAVLRRALQLMVGPLMPVRLRVSIDAEHLLHVRLGIPIALATGALVASQQMSLLAWLS